MTLFDQEKVMEIHDYHIAEAARRDGLQEGRAEGRAEGITEGIAKGTLGSICSLMKNLGMTLEQALVAVDVPEAEYSKYASLLHKQ